MGSKTGTGSELCSSVVCEIEDQAQADCNFEGNIVIHVDVDAFFVQVEVLRNPLLHGKAVAVQQHQDIIAANYPARQAGVKKHMRPAEARGILHKVGGLVQHVFCEEGGRVSYRPYRETSAALMRLLKRFMNAAVVEKASIDEAYVLCHPPGQGPGSGCRHDVGLGAQLGAAIRGAAKSELGLAVSVGVASNKLLAKLASRAAKPDGMKVVQGPAAVQSLLQATRVEQLPGMGGKVANALAQAGLVRVEQLQQLTVGQLVDGCGLRPAVAALLHSWCHGADASEVQDKGPPQSLRVQMTLTPVPLAAFGRGTGGATAAVAPGGAPGTLQPLPVGAPDSRARLSRLLRSMCADLVSRVLLDRHQENRWPSKLGVMVATNGPGGGPGGKTASKSAAFPAPYLVDSWPAAAPGAPDGAARGPAAQVPPGGDSGLVMSENVHAGGEELLDAAVSCAVHLAQALLALNASTSVITQVAVTAMGFGLFEAASGYSPIHHYFAPAAARRDVGQEVGAAAPPPSEEHQIAGAQQVTPRDASGAISTCAQPRPTVLTGGQHLAQDATVALFVEPAVEPRMELQRQVAGVKAGGAVIGHSAPPEKRKRAGLEGPAMVLPRDRQGQGATRRCGRQAPLQLTDLFAQLASPQVCVHWDATRDVYVTAAVHGQEGRHALQERMRFLGLETLMM